MLFAALAVAFVMVLLTVVIHFFGIAALLRLLRHRGVGRAPDALIGRPAWCCSSSSA